MAIDLEQFHQVFFEESIEGLDVMESALMELDPEAIDDETINAIFRSAHSIKGGSATFGFSSIADFTHVLETLLDQVRSGARGLSPQDINLLLQSVDCMREMLSLLQQGENGVTEDSISLKRSFTAILDGEKHAPEAEAEGFDAPAEQKNSSSLAVHLWSIHFAPSAALFLSGNDPLRQLRELAQLGEMTCICSHAHLPSLTGMDSESSYLSWDISLRSSASLKAIQEVFEWVEDECDLAIEQSESTFERLHNWHIEFAPGISILRTGNEPMRIIRALRSHGELSICTNAGDLPNLFLMNTENCYFRWDIVLRNTEIDKEEVEEIFEWVADDADIHISECSASFQLPVSEKDVIPLEDANKSSDKRQEKAPQVSHDSIPSSSVNKKNTAVGTPDKTKKVTTENTSIRVGIDKVDNLINMVGELVITQSMLGQLGTQHELERVPKLMEGLSQLEQNTRELQESVMKIRMLPISFAFSRFPRMVRDLGQTLGKSVVLEMQGENTELDKTVMEKIGDPLVHLVRNAVDHGIETPEERVSQGKSETGLINLNAFHQSGNVVIEIIDNGRGLDKQKIVEKALENGLIYAKDVDFLSDEQIYDLIFQPGFSTAKVVSDVSGRGVGMDVVKRNIQALNGIVEISSTKGEGSKITVKLPLTLAILDGQLVRVGSNTYIFPLVSIVESMQCRSEFINRVAGGCKVFKLRDEYVPIVELYKAFSVVPDSTSVDDSLLVVVECDGDKIGIVVDDLLAQQQVVIKSLEHNYRRVDGVSGATILGDGTVALILDIPGIVRLSAQQVGMSVQSLASIVSSYSTSFGDAELRSAAG